MIRGVLIVLGLGIAGGRIGLTIANWWVDTRMPAAELDEMLPLFAGTAAGALAGIGIGIAIAYALGKRELR